MQLFSVFFIEMTIIPPFTTPFHPIEIMTKSLTKNPSCILLSIKNIQNE